MALPSIAAADSPQEASDTTSAAESQHAAAAANRPPTIRRIADVVGAEGDPDRAMALRATDPDGNPLRFVVHNSAPEVVGATAVGQSLYIDFKKQGTAEITVTVVDSRGASDSTMFQVKVRQRPFVRLEGTVEDGTGLPIAQARCRYTTTSLGTELDTATADDTGKFRLLIAPGKRGVIECFPPGRRSLTLATFVSTRELEGGETRRQQDVTPLTTVIANIIEAENPFNPEARKADLLTHVTRGHPLTLLTDIATSLYTALLARPAIPTNFQAAMQDVFTNGAVELAALQPIAAAMVQAVEAAEAKHSIGVEASAASLLEMNVAPRARSRTWEVQKDRPTTITLLIEDEVDANGDPVQISAVTQGAHGSVRITPNKRSVVYDPDPDFEQMDMFTYTMRDATGLQDTATVKVRATAGNRPPRLQSIDAISAVKDTPDRTVDLEASDPDQAAGTLDYEISANSDPTVVGARLQGQAVLLNFKAPGTSMITVRVTDAQGASDATTFTVTVRNRLPHLQAIDPIEAVKQTPDRTVPLRASDADQNAATLDYAISANSDPAVVSARLQGQAVLLNFKAPGTSMITVRVTDAQGASDTTTFTVTVRNRRPQLEALRNLVGAVDALDRIVNLRATDPDGGILSFSVDPPVPANIVGATIVDQRRLVIDFQAPGTASLTVRVTDPQGASDEDTFTVTVRARPAVNRMDNQQHRIGTPGVALPLSATDCTDCDFAVSNLPPNLTVDRNARQITGDISYGAYNVGPEYTVAVTARDRSTNLESQPVFFNWRVIPEEVTEQPGPGGEGGGDGDGDGDSGDGDGGAGGDAGDGGDASPLAEARCVLVDMNGAPILNEVGEVIQDDTDSEGKFLLRIPHDKNNPEFVMSLEGFIECFHPQKNKLILSRYINTRGLRKGERLVGLSVNPTTTVVRQIHEGLNTALLRTDPTSRTRSVDVPPDLIAIQAQYLNDIAGLQTQSPRLATDEEDDDSGCTGGNTTTTVVRDINIPLQTPPNSQRGKRSGLAAYVASQLFLAAFKGEDVEPGRSLDSRNCAEDASGNPSATEFRAVLQRYFTNKSVTSQELLDLGLPKDDGLITEAVSGGCG